MKWSEQEISILKSNYFKKTKELIKILNRTPKAIRLKAKELKINKINYKFWTDQDIELLKDIYEYETQENITSKLNRKWINIVQKADELGLKRFQSNKHLINGDLSILLKENLQSYYWIGFLLADGHFSKNNRLVLCLQKRDIKHIQSFANFIQCKTVSTYSKNSGFYNRVHIMDSILVPKIKEKFCITHNKTENPPNIEFYKNTPSDLILALFIGYMDGDGCIKKQPKRRDVCGGILVHKNWFEFVNYMKSHIENVFNINLANAYINKRGYTSLFLNQQALIELKKFIIKNNLQILQRKWDLIEV